jgi:hypothetical protein
MPAPTAPKIPDIVPLVFLGSLDRKVPGFAAMVIVSRNGKVNLFPRPVHNPRATGTFAISRLLAAAMRLRRIHRDT